MNMSEALGSERVRRGLVVAIGAVLLLGVGGVVVADRSDPGGGTTRAEIAPDAETRPAATRPEGTVDPVAPISPGRGVDPVTGPAPAAAPALPSSSVVPADGAHRYEVAITTDGVATVAEEVLEVSRISGDSSAGVVQISQRVDGDGQRSVLDWSPGGVTVRSTEIDQGSECVWEPPVTEFGALAVGTEWSIDSRCEVTVAGVPTTVEVTGSGRVVGTETVTAGGGSVAAWRIERSRTTVLRADVGGDEMVQRVEDVGVVFFDPTRGIAVRRESTVERSGQRSGTTRRVAVLKPADTSQ